MATGLAAKIVNALFTRVASFSVGSPAMPVAYPDIAFTPPADGKYLVAAYLPNKPAWEGISEGKLAQGLLQITVVWPRGEGIVAPAEIAQSVMDHFPKGLVLTDTGAKITINSEPYDGTPIFGENMVSIPITIPWVAAAT